MPRTPASVKGGLAAQAICCPYSNSIAQSRGHQRWTPPQSICSERRRDKSLDRWRMPTPRHCSCRRAEPQGDAYAFSHLRPSIDGSLTFIFSDYRIGNWTARAPSMVLQSPLRLHGAPIPDPRCRHPLVPEEQELVATDRTRSPGSGVRRSGREWLDWVGRAPPRLPCGGAP